MMWGEEPSIYRDIARGKLSSYVLAVVYTPKQGFGEYIKVPNRVVWYLVSSKPRIARLGERSIVTYDRKTIYVPVETVGMYRDYTYGFYIDVDEREDTTLLRLGLSYLMVFLRKVYGIPFETIMYSVGRIGERKFFELHEPEAAGLIEALDWASIRRELEKYSPSDLDLVLLLQLDDIAYSDLISLGVDLEVVKGMAVRAVDYILLSEKVSAFFRGRKISIPKPSKALRILALDAIAHTLDEEEVVKRTISGIAVYDGESVERVVDLYVMYPFVPPPKSLRDFEAAVEDAVLYGGMKLVVLDKESTARGLEKTGLRRLSRTVKEHGVSVRDGLARLGLEPLSLSTIVGELSVEGLDIDAEHVDIAELYKIFAEQLRAEDRLSELPKQLRTALEKHLEARAKTIYMLYLVVEEMLKQQSTQQLQRV